jgi:hypothetical protein
MKRPILLIHIYAVFLLYALSTKAQLNLDVNQTYSQTFDGLSNSSSTTYTNNSNIPSLGWYMQKTSGSSSYTPGTGSSSSGAVYSFGSTGSSDRALGCVPSAVTGNIAWGVELKNNTGYSIKEFTITYAGEQWRNGGSGTTQNVSFWYQISASPITSTTPSTNNGWTSMSSMDFSSPINTTTGGALNGNLAANRTIYKTHFTTDVPSGSELMFRWAYPYTSGIANDGLAMDDFTFTYEPVAGPTSFATSNNTSTSYDVSWTAPSATPTGYIVFREASIAPTFTPGDDTTYTVGNTYKGAECVYIGSTPGFSESSLSTGTTYYYKIYAYNGANGTINYLQTGALTGNETPTSTATALIVIGSISGFGTVPVGSYSAEASYNVNGTNLTGDIVVTSPSSDFEISTSSGSGFTSTNPITIPEVGGNASGTIYVRFHPSTGGSQSGSITNASSGATTQNVDVSGTGLQNFYLASSGYVDNVNSWGSNTDGTGSHPANFTDDYQIFNITNQTNAAINGTDWTVSGNESNVILGDGTNAITFTIDQTQTLTSSIDLLANSTIVLKNATMNHSYGIVDPSSTIEFAQVTGASVYTIPADEYFNNIIISGGNKAADLGTTYFDGNLTIDGVSNFGSPSGNTSTYDLAGNLTLTNSPTFDASNPIIINCYGGTQTFTGNGTDISLYQLIVNGGSTNVQLSSTGGTSNLVLGNSNGGGLDLEAGNILTLGSNTLDLEGDAVFTTGATGTISGNGTGSNITINKTGATALGTMYMTTNASTLNNLTLDLSNGSANTLTVGSDLGVNGTLALTAGQLDFSAQTLSVNGTISGSGTLSPSSSSSLTIGGSTGSVGTLNFTSGHTTLANFTMNRTSSGTAVLGNALTVNTALTMTNGTLTLGSNDLNLGSSSTASGTATSWVYPDGSGRVVRTIGSSSFGFPIGTSDYTPINMQQTGTATSVRVGILDNLVDSAGNAVTSNGVNKMWEVTAPSGDLSGLGVTLQWNTADELSGFVSTSSFVAYKNASHNWQTTHWKGKVATDLGGGAFSLPEVNLVQLSGVTTDYTVGDTFSALPVTLLAFNAKADGENVDLNWATASEINNDRFVVERSFDGKNWLPIQTVAGHGTTQVRNDYATVDNGPFASNVLYYRLKQIDYNGTYTYSVVRVVKFAAESVVAMNVYPNPTHDKLNLAWTGTAVEPVRIQIFDMNGMPVYQQDATNRKGLMQLQLDLSSLASGNYYLRISSNTLINSQPIIKY